MSQFRSIGALGAIVGAVALWCAPVQAKDMVFTSWGGTTQDAQKQSWAVPFSKKSSVTVLQDGPTDYGKLKAMVESGKPAWAVVDVESDFAVKAGKDGLLEPLDFSIIDKAKLDPRFVTPYSVGSFYYSFVLGYNKDQYGKATPKGWVDLFDQKTFPGKRTLYKWSAPGVLELALLADGVTPDKLYPLDLDRAFKKLDTLKSNIVWWSGGAQSQQLLVSGEAPIGMLWNGRIDAIRKSGVDVGVSWNQNLAAADALVVPKGLADKETAMKFIAFATSPQAQADFARASGYAPINLDSKALMKPEETATLPDSQSQSQITLDMAYWAEHRDEIAKRWYEWQGK